MKSLTFWPSDKPTSQRPTKPRISAAAGSRRESGMLIGTINKEQVLPWHGSDPAKLSLIGRTRDCVSTARGCKSIQHARLGAGQCSPSRLLGGQIQALRVGSLGGKRCPFPRSKTASAGFRGCYLGRKDRAGRVSLRRDRNLLMTILQPEAKGFPGVFSPKPHKAAKVINQHLRAA